MFRFSRPVATALLTTAAGTLLLTGCGDDSDGDAGAASSSSSPASSTASSPASSSGGGGAAADPAAFCEDAVEVFGRLSEAFEAIEGQSLDASVPVLDQAVGAFDQLEPPAEITDDWQVVRNGFADLRDAVDEIDADAADAEAQAEAAVQDIEADISPSLERVDAYYSENCETGAAPAS